MTTGRSSATSTVQSKVPIGIKFYLKLCSFFNLSSLHIQIAVDCCFTKSLQGYPSSLFTIIRFLWLMTHKWGRDPPLGPSPISQGPVLSLSVAFFLSAGSCGCGCRARLVAGSALASEMRHRLKEELGIRCSAGIGHNKLLAKVRDRRNVLLVLFVFFIFSQPVSRVLRAVLSSF